MGVVEKLQFYKLGVPTIGPRRFFAAAFFVIIALAASARAIGWGPTDFLIGGGTAAFTNRIGVFDSNLNFKGYLDSSFLGTAGMDFDSAGHLVAVSWALHEVRVYDSTGARIGGFVRPDNAISASADLKVAPNGDYIIGQTNSSGADGARRFSPDGTFLQQYGSGEVRGVAVVPGDTLWTGRIGSSVVTTFSITGGLETGSLQLAGPDGVFSMRFDGSTGDVLISDASTGSVYECDLAGNVGHVFNAAAQGHHLGSGVRGPDGDLFATTGTDQTVLRWHADGTFVGSYSTSAFGGVAGIVWAGSVPEPSGGALLVMAALIAGTRSGWRVLG
ncbi:MAG: hypothetical protein ACREJC_10270 [Tepidisphaeraceae bacterium]